MFPGRREIEILKEHLCQGLQPNTKPPQGHDELLRELIHLDKHFKNAQTIEKEFLEIYEKDIANSGPMLTCGVIIGAFVFIFFIGIINAFIESTIVWLFMAVLAVGIVVSLKLNNERAAKAGAKEKEMFRTMYLGANNNFIRPEDIFFLSILVDIAKDKDVTNYRELMIRYNKYLDDVDDFIREIRINDEIEKQKRIKVQKPSTILMRCPRCGQVFEGYGVGSKCPYCCTRSDKMV